MNYATTDMAKELTSNLRGLLTVVALVACLSTIALPQRALAAVEDVPVLERLQIAASALYEMGQDNNQVAAAIVPYDSLDRSVALVPVELGPNGQNLARHLSSTVFYGEGAYAKHLDDPMQQLVVTAFLRTLWAVDTNALTFFEISSETPGKVPGDDGMQKASSALGIMHEGRVLIMRGVALD